MPKPKRLPHPSPDLPIGKRPASLQLPELGRRKTTTRIVVHCSATKPAQDIGVAEIDGWHRDRHWKCIGYHVVIRRNGTVEHGRPLNTIGAHAKDYNTTSVSVCLVGGIDTLKKSDTNFTLAQWRTLDKVLKHLRAMYPEAKIVGHRELDKHGKTCPTFDASQLLPETDADSTSRHPPPPLPSKSRQSVSP